METEAAEIAVDVMGACRRANPEGDDLVRAVIKKLADQIGPDLTRPELVAPRSLVQFFNTPAGAVCEGVLIPKCWVLPDGSWTRTPPASISRDLIAKLRFIWGYCAIGHLSGSEGFDRLESELEAAYDAILEAIS